MNVLLNDMAGEEKLNQFIARIEAGEKDRGG